MQNLPTGIMLNVERLAVVGESGGGFAARAACLYAVPKPKAVLLQYATGGECLDNHWLSVKDEETWPVPGAPFVKREMVAHLLDEPQAEISVDPLLSLGDEPLAPGVPQTMRSAIFLYWLKEGELLDHIVGQKISHVLRELPYGDRLAALPEHLRPAVLQTQIDGKFPPTFLLHGKKDTLVLPAESRNTYDTLERAGVEVESEEVENADHALTKPRGENGTRAFDPSKPPPLVAGAEESQKKAFDFLLKHLTSK